MLLTLVSALALGLTQQDKPEMMWVYQGDPARQTTHTAYSVVLDRIDPPKFSPKKFGNDDPQPYEFDWLVAGYGRYGEGDNLKLKFRVFSQERKPQGDRGPMVALMLNRLWDLNFRRYKLENPAGYNSGVVDFYLCWGGSPGGEQRFDVDKEGNPPMEKRVDTVYIYDLGSFTDPVEMAREVAHEYGHAVLPPIGGFATPEDWGNGQLGEKLYLTWMRNAMNRGELQPADVMGSDLKPLDAWVKKNVDPLVTNVALNGVEWGLLEGQGQASMDAYTGLVCYADRILPANVVGRSLKLTGSTRAQDYPAALLMACKEKGRVVLEMPAELKGKDIWVPLGDGKVTGAQVLRKSHDWALIRPGLIVTTLVFG